MMDPKLSERANIPLTRETSMLHWWPKIQGLGLPLPGTVIVELTREECVDLWGFVTAQEDEHREVEGLPVDLVDRLQGAAEWIGYPLFMRTDQASGKHEWKDTCYVEKGEDLIGHLSNLLMWHEMANLVGLPWQAVVFRELLHLRSTFAAFNGMPVAAERRYFVRDGAVICHHPYWVKEAIEQGHGLEPLPKGWKKKLWRLNCETVREATILPGLAERFSRAVEGYWSVDFAQDIGSNWWLIDAARGELSWHPDGCTKKEPAHTGEG